MKKRAKKNKTKIMLRPFITKAALGLLIALSAPALVAQVLAANIAPASGTVPARHNTITQNNVTNGAHTSNWTEEGHYWHDHYGSTPYYNGQIPYSTYEPAYRYGMNIYGMNNGCRWDKLDQKTLREGWEREHREHNDSTLSWDQAQPAVRDSYTHMCTSRATGISANSPMGGGR